MVTQLYAIFCLKIFYATPRKKRMDERELNNRLCYLYTKLFFIKNFRRVSEENQKSRKKFLSTLQSPPFRRFSFYFPVFNVFMINLVSLS